MPGPDRNPSLLLRLATVLLFLAGLAGVTASVYELGQARRAWASLKAARAEYQTEQSQSRILERRVVAREPPAGEPEAAAPSGNNPDSGTKAGGAEGADADWDRLQQAQLFLNAYPQVRAMLAAFAKAQFYGIFGPFLRTANLSESQIEQLEQVVTDNWLNHLVLGPKGQFGAGSMLPPEAQLQAVLGEQGAGQLQDFLRARPAQRVATQIAAANGYAGTPLSADQSAQLTQAIAASSASYQKGKSANLDNVNWASAQAQADAVLTPPQAELANRAFAKLQYQQALQAARQAVRAAAGK
ncbi:MAG TPA: hypothetical protein VHC86_01750 [Opitutaceae bacterium]|nr:hypothetical protein [Opitutaceae bacterium]